MKLIDLGILVASLCYLTAGFYYTTYYQEIYERSFGLLEGLFYGALLTFFWPFHKAIELFIKRRMK